MYSGVYTGGVILSGASKMATWGNKRKKAKSLKLSFGIKVASE